MDIEANGQIELYYGKFKIILSTRSSLFRCSTIPLMMLSRVNHKFLDRGNHHEFLSLVKELARPGDITQNTSFDFEFNQVEKPYECYTGANVKLR